MERKINDHRLRSVSFYGKSIYFGRMVKRLNLKCSPTQVKLFTISLFENDFRTQKTCGLTTLRA